MRPVLFIDSGIGGIPYCRQFIERNPACPVVYAADRAHFPYGGRSRAELEKILCDLVGRLAEMFAPALVVLACNTATVSALDCLRGRFPDLQFVGTVPAVKPAVEQTRTGKIGVLGTERTVGDPYLWELAAAYGSGCTVIAKAAPDLVEFVEKKIGGETGAGESEKKNMIAPYVDYFRCAGADGIVLGCTHFLFLLDEFRCLAAPGIQIFDSVDGIRRRAETLLAGHERGGNAAGEGDYSAGKGGGTFIVTGGAAAESWRYWADYLGLELRAGVAK